MENMEKLAKARRELEDLYMGVDDDSVNLSFANLASVKPPHASPSSEKRNSGPLEPVSSQLKTKKEEPAATLARLPSLDFNRGLFEQKSTHGHHQNQNQNHPLHDQHGPQTRHQRHVSDDHTYLGHGGDGLQGSQGRGYQHVEKYRTPEDPASPYTPRGEARGFRLGVMENNMDYDKMSNLSGMTTPSMTPNHQGGGRRRLGIPHSNICTICSSYIYMSSHRCLVCGRAYCKQCAKIGMGEMTEGRKCIECLGRRFSQRYIQRAGQIGCCMRFSYPSTVMQQELTWAEKGPRRGDERLYDHSSQSPMNPRTPNRAYASPINPRSPIRAHASPMNPRTPSRAHASPMNPRTPTRAHASPMAPRTPTRAHASLGT